MGVCGWNLLSYSLIPTHRQAAGVSYVHSVLDEAVPLYEFNDDNSYFERGSASGIRGYLSM